MTAIDVPTALPTVGFFSVGSSSSHERTQIPQMAFTGTRSRLETWRQSWCPGRARSRENANIIREADVTEASPQKSWARHAMNRRNSAHFVLIEVSQMYFTA